MTTTAFRRRPRVPPRGVEATPVTFQPPPEIPATTGTSPLMTLLPLLGGVGSLAFFVVGGSGAASWIGGGAMFASMLAMGAANVGRAGGKRRSQMTADRRDYLRHLGHVRTTVRGVADAQRASLEQLHPVPDALGDLARGPRLWERRPRDGDFAAVRLGTGPQRLAAPLEAPETGPAEDLEPVSAAALRRFVTAHRAVDGLPVAVALRSFSSVVLTGAQGAREDLARAVLAQLATWHSPDELRLAVLADRDRAQTWDWLKWLPHARHPRLRDAAGETRLWAPDPQRLAALLADDLADRAAFAPVSRAGALEALPFVVVLDDTGRLVPGDLTGGVPPAGVCVLGLADPGTVTPGPDRLVLELDPMPVRVRRATSPSRAVHDARSHGAAPVLGVAGEPVPVGVADALGHAEVTALVRAIGTRRPARTGSDPVADPLSATTDLGTLLGTGDLGALDVASSWRRGNGRHRLAVPLGVGPDGEQVELDLKEAAAGGMGPHGLVIGATGSGKSELLRTLVLGLAVTHSSEALNFVLIDFKGGATFAGLAELPHTAAVITNLADDLSMVDRMRDALAGEMNRRQEVLRAAGNHASVREYEAARAAGADLEPLPSLVVVCDEFSELLSAKPDFIDLFVAIGRLGRSLGVHLCLASQRLEEGRLRGLDSHLSYRIGLKTFSAQESRAVLGVPDAFELPPVPGSGYLKFDAGMWRFKGSYVSGPYGDGAPAAWVESGGGRTRGTAVAPFGVVPADAPLTALAAPAGVVPVEVGGPPDEVGGPVEGAPEDGRRSGALAAPAVDRGGPLGPTLLDVVVDRLAGEGPPPHQVWLPPLDESPTLDDLLGPLSADGDGGLRPLAAPLFATGSGGPAAPLQSSLRVPIGIVDRPYEQRRDPLVVDLAGAAGHVAVVGGPQTGKSTALRTLVTALALTNTPRQLQVYAVDLGGGALGALAGLPHVGTVASRLQPDVVRRTIAEVARLLSVRERAFLDAGVESMAAWRAMRARDEGPDDGYGDVLLVIDGWASFRAEHDALEATVTDLAARGLSLGVHVVVTANRWAEIRASLKDLLGTRVELRLGDPGESEVDRRTAVTVPAGRPGRGLAADRRHLLVGLPRADGQRRTDDLAEATTALARAVDGAWTGPRAPAVRMLPDLLTPAELPRVSRTGCSIPVGVDEAALAPVLLDLDAEPHLLVFGDSESGKSGLLRLVARALADRYTPDRARLLLIDPRRSLLGCVPEVSLLGYASSTVAAAPLTAEVRTAMENRLPGPDVTAAQLRDRSWWRGPELFVVVDDYDLVATAGGNPVAPLADLLAQGGDIGLHVIVARRSGGAGRAMFDPVLGRLRDLAQPGVLLSGSKDEGVLVGSARPQPLPPGRAQLVTRRGGASLVQLAWSPPA